ncbi:metallophosphoesterase [bacterium]|nr:metallophosphoesterase [bacterium]
MARPLAIVLSDLHLGEESSVLHYGQKFKKGKQPLVNKLIKLLKETLSNETIPFLILAGDTLDLSLASVQGAVADFRLFLEDVHEFFDNFVYIPGNHDHHMWRTLQEQVFVVNRIREGEKIGDFPQEQIGTVRDGKIVLKGVNPKKTLGAKTFLNDLLPEAAKGKNFAVTYPNVFLKFKNSERDILITHGHFFEVAWTLVSDIFKKSLNLTAMNYRVLERINSPLTEFGWYGLGQAGKLSNFIEELYGEIKNSEDKKLTLALNDVRDYLDELWTFKPTKREGFFSRIRAIFSQAKAAIKEELSDQALKLMTDLVKSLIVSQFEEREPYTGGSPLRHCPNMLDDPSKKDRITRYVSYSFGRPYEFSPYQIIFGHTHVPIKQGSIDVAVDGTPHNIAAFNTGGWVVDTKEATEIIHSRPMPFSISDEGIIEPIDFPWPYDEEEIANKKETEIIDIIQKEFGIRS